MKHCRNCVYAKILHVDRKGDAYECTKVSGYQFMGYWKKVKSDSCNNFKPTL